MNWFTDEKTPINLAMLYVEEPDGQSHMYGPDSINVSLSQRIVLLSIELSSMTIAC